MEMINDYIGFTSGSLGSEPEETTPWYSGALDFFKDVGSSAVTDLSIASKAKIQTEINKNLLGAKEEASPYDIGRLQYDTDHTNRSGLIPEFSIPTPSLPKKPESISMQSFIPNSFAKYFLFGGIGITGLILLKKFIK